MDNEPWVEIPQELFDVVTRDTLPDAIDAHNGTRNTYFEAYGCRVKKGDRADGVKYYLQPID